MFISLRFFLSKKISLDKVITSFCFFKKGINGHLRKGSQIYRKKYIANERI